MVAMNSDNPTPQDERFDLLLAACDDDLAAGNDTPSVPGPEVPGDLKVRLERGVAWCQRVRRLLRGPDSALTSPSPPAATETTAPALTRLGRFQVRRELGRGGCGVVFLAFDPQ